MGGIYSLTAGSKFPLVHSHRTNGNTHFKDEKSMRRNSPFDFWNLVKSFNRGVDSGASRIEIESE